MCKLGQLTHKLNIKYTYELAEFTYQITSSQ